MRSTRHFVAFIGMVALSLFCINGSAHAHDHATLQVHQIVDGMEVVDELALDELKALGVASFVTSTIWTDGEIEFHGVPMGAVLKHLGLSEGAIEIVASNDYFVEIPVADLLEDAALLSFSMNGQAMSTRDKGPLWLVYPYDTDVTYQSETYYARSIWQIVRLRILP